MKMRKYVFFNLLAIAMFLVPNLILGQKSTFNKVKKATNEAYDDTRKQIDRTIKDIGNAPRKTADQVERTIADEKKRRNEDASDGPVMFIVESSEFEAVKRSENGGMIYRALQNIKVKYRCPRSDYDMFLTRKKGELFEIGPTCNLKSVDRDW